MTKKIYLRGKHSDKFTVVDDDDYEWLSRHKWYLSSDGYAIRIKWEDNKSKTIFMHREILKPLKGMYTDHINRDKLDNRRINLREVTRSENAINTSFLGHKDNNSGHVGVHYRKDIRMFEAYITKDKIKHHLGIFKNADDAVDAYLRKRRELYGNLVEEDM